MHKGEMYKGDCCFEQYLRDNLSSPYLHRRGCQRRSQATRPCHLLNKLADIYFMSRGKNMKRAKPKINFAYNYFVVSVAGI